MATRYWVGDTGNWNDTAHWSDSDGGSSGFSVPTSSNDVIFSSGSFSADGAIVTIDVAASCLSLNSSAADQYFTITSSVYTLSIYGSLTEHATNSRYNFTGTAYLYFKGTGTITTNGNTLYHAWNRMYIDGVGITVTNGDNFTASTTTPYIANGTWNHANYDVTTSGMVLGVGTKTITLGSGTWNLLTATAYFHINAAGFTFNCGTSLIKSQNTTGGAGLYTTTRVFYNIECYVITFTGSGSCNNLTIIGQSAGSKVINAEGAFTINGIFTVSGNNATNNRLIFYSNVIGTPRTITCNGTVVASNVDFRDITGAGSASWDLSAITGLSGDCGGNSGITFTTAEPQYFKNLGEVLKDTGFDDSSLWNKSAGVTIENGVCTWLNVASGQNVGQTRTIPYFTGKSITVTYTIDSISSGGVRWLESGNIRTTAGTFTENFTMTTQLDSIYLRAIGTTSCVISYFSVVDTYNFNWQNSTNWFSDASPRTTAGRVPLPQDDVTFDASSFTGSSTLTLDCTRIGRSLDMSEVNQALTLAISQGIESYGNHIRGNNITETGVSSLTLMGRGNFTLNLHNKTIYWIYVNCDTGKYTNLSDITLTYPGNAALQIISGTFDLNDFNYTGKGLSQSNSNKSILYMGNGTYTNIQTVTGGAVTEFSTASTLYCENSTIILNTPSGTGVLTLNTGNKNLNKVIFSGLHSGYYNISGSSIINEIIIDAGRKVRFTAGTTQTVNKLTAVGTKAAPITISSITAAQHTINSPALSNISCDWLNLSYSNATGAARFYAGGNSVNAGNNTGWNFFTSTAGMTVKGRTVIGPRESIVTDGLVMYLDAANPRSYPGTGTAWNDMAGKNNGVLTNGPTFSPAYSGGLVFDGIDDYAEMNNKNYNRSAITVESFFKFNNYYASGYKVGIIGTWQTGAGNNNEFLLVSGITSASPGLPNFGIQINTIKYGSTGTTVMQPGIWYHLAGTYDGSNVKVYVNGNVEGNQTPAIGIIDTIITQPLLLAAFGSSKNYNSDITISIARIYNRALSPSEVLQNFNATRSRYKI